MTIEDFLRLLLRNLLLLILGTVLGAAAGFGISFTQKPVYAATALGYVSASTQMDDEGNPIAAASGNMQYQYSKAQSYLPLFNTRAVGDRIVEEMGLEISSDAVAGSLTATLDPNAPIITVTALAGSPQAASDIANAAVQATAEEARELEGGEAAGVQLVPYQTALTPGAPVSPDRQKYLLAGAAAGLLLALGIAWLRDRNDNRLRSADDIKVDPKVTLLGVLPDLKEMARPKDGVLPDPTTFHAREALRKLRTNLRFVDVDNPPRSIVVTSSAPGEGKSTVAGNLARVMARAGHRTLLIDADLRRPVVATEFDIDGSVGLSQLLAGSVRLDEVIQEIPKTRLSVLPAGQIPPNPSELLGSRRMNELISQLTKSYFVILDAPPVLAVTDAQLLARQADGAIVVAVPNKTRVEPVTRAIQSIRDVNAKVYGLVLNRASTSRLTRLAYGDSEYSSYGYGAYGYASKKGYGYDNLIEDDGIEADSSEFEVAVIESAPAPTTSALPRRRARRAATEDDPAS